MNVLRPPGGWLALAPRPLAPVPIIETHDIVLTQIASRLNLDDLQGLGAQVFHPVLGANRNVGRLV